MKNKTHFCKIFFAGILLSGLLFYGSGSKTAVRSMQISFDSVFFANTANETTGVYAVEFLAPDSAKLPDTAREAIIKTLNASNSKSPENEKYYLVGIRWENSWALASITSANLDSPLQEGQHTHLTSDNMFTLILAQTKNGWQAAIDIDEGVDNLLAYIPESELSQTARVAIFPVAYQQEQMPSSLEQQYFNYKFPWPSGYAWRSTTGVWHGTSGEVGDNALDFDINSPYTNSDILAAAPGTILWVCQGTADQYYLRIQTDGTTERFGYLHLDGATVRAEGIVQGDRVTQGEKLGRMWEGVGGDNCGYSEGTHIHLHFPDKPFTIDGITFKQTDTHYGEALYSSQSGGGCCGCSTSSTESTYSFVDSYLVLGDTYGPSPLLADDALKISPGDFPEVGLSDDYLAVDDSAPLILAFLQRKELVEKESKWKIDSAVQENQQITETGNTNGQILNFSVNIIPPSSNNYVLEKSVIGISGNKKSSASYTVISTTGQFHETGELHGQNYKVLSGFWPIANPESFFWHIFAPIVTK